MFSDFQIIHQQPKEIDPHVLSWVEHIPFAFFLVDFLRPKSIVELGVHSGNSFNAFCQAVKHLSIDCTCFGIDNWAGDEQAGHYSETVYNKLLAYQQSNYSDLAKLIKSDFADACQSFDDESIDLLHIDGLHTYEAVKLDFETWLPKVSPKGLIVFHDSEVFDRDFGVHRLMDELKHDYSVFQFKHGHGLSVLAKNNSNTQDLLFKHLAQSGQSLFEKLGKQVRKEIEKNSHKKRLATKHHKLYFSKVKDIFTEKQSLQQPLTEPTIKLTVHLGELQNSNFFRFDPINCSATIVNLKVELEAGQKKSSIENLSHNGELLADGNVYFNHADPQFRFNFSNHNKDAILHIEYQILLIRPSFS